MPSPRAHLLQPLNAPSKTGSFQQAGLCGASSYTEYKQSSNNVQSRAGLWDSTLMYMGFSDFSWYGWGVLSMKKLIWADRFHMRCIQTLPAQLADHETRLQELQNKMAALKGMQPLWIRFSDLRDKGVPEQQVKVLSVEQQLRAQQNEVRLCNCQGTMQHCVHRWPKFWA